MSHGTDSVRTSLAGSVGIKAAIWEFKYYLGFYSRTAEAHPQAGRDSLKMTAVMSG